MKSWLSKQVRESINFPWLFWSINSYFWLSVPNLENGILPSFTWLLNLPSSDTKPIRNNDTLVQRIILGSVQCEMFLQFKLCDFSRLNSEKSSNEKNHPFKKWANVPGPSALRRDWWGFTWWYKRIFWRWAWGYSLDIFKGSGRSWYRPVCNEHLWFPPKFFWSISKF